jgi:hypothetical protein
LIRGQQTHFNPATASTRGTRYARAGIVVIRLSFPNSYGGVLMRLLMCLPWRWLCALAITALFLLAAYDLSEEARYYAAKLFIWPIERAMRLGW